MDDASQPLVGWRELAESIPDGVGIQRGEQFVYASEELAATVGVEPDALVGEPWHVLFDSGEATRLERAAVERARTDGRWTGEAHTGGALVEGTPIELTLSATDHGVLVWTIAGREPAAGESVDPTSESGDPASGSVDPPTEWDSPLQVRPSLVGAVLDAVDDVVYVLDEDGETVLWNERLVETTGYSHEEIDAMHSMKLIPEDHHQYVPGLMDAIDAIEDRRVDVDVLTKGGERITHEFSGTTFEDPETGEVFRCGIARDVTDQRKRERELERYETLVETVEDGIYALDEDLRFSFVNDGLCELLGTTRDELLGTPAMTLFEFDDEADAAEEIRREVVEGDTDRGVVQGTVTRPDGERVLESHYRLRPDADGEFRGSVGVIRDVTERLERQRALERQRDELEALDRITELLLETVRELIQTASRDAVERAVCERLVASEFYRFAWVGEREFDGERIRPRTTAGDDDDYLEEVTITDDDSATGQGPAGRAMATGEVQVAEVDDPAFEPWRDAASERDVASVAAVPLQDDGTVYGVLVVYATREDAFGEREQAGFDVLGRTVGSVIHAARSRELLFADAVVELEFRLGDAETPIARAASEVGCELALEGYVASGEQWVLYFGVDGAPPDAVIEALSGERRIERARVLTADDDAGRIELVVAASSLLDAATAAGATVRTATADADGARLVVEAPIDAEARQVAEHVRSEFPDAELVTRRERDREPITVGRPGGLLGDLTDRQREVLEAAYRSGYFGWPRESTAEEVAESLALAAPTLHGHLRKAEDAILAALFDG